MSDQEQFSAHLRRLWQKQHPDLRDPETGDPIRWKQAPRNCRECGRPGSADRTGLCPTCVEQWLRR